MNVVVIDDISAMNVKVWILSLGYLDMSCRSRLATLNEKLTALERRIEYIEARVSALHCVANIFFSIIFE